MTEYLCVCPCHFGLEAVLKRELEYLALPIERTEDGKVYFKATSEGIARANLFLRTAERVMMVAGEFTATDFDELFEKTKALPWDRFLPEDGAFWVTKANSVKSKLFSPSDIQSIMKKAIVEKMKLVYHTDVIPESGEEYPIRVSILKDRVTVSLDTSGISLHKRGYRVDTVKAPISETLASALLLLTPWKEDRILVDPFCGSGTFPIEAALMATHTAPGLDRHFTCEKWKNLFTPRDFFNATEEALDLITPDVETDIQGYDIDPLAIRSARENAVRAGMDKYVHFQVRDVKDLRHHGKYGFLVTNPPYGERISEKEELPSLYQTLGERFKALDNWSLFCITSYEDAEKYIGRAADKNRKIYNGMLKTYFYSFLGEKPPKRANRNEFREEK